MPLLLPFLLLFALFAIALLMWPVTLWRRTRTGHLRRRVRLWPYAVRLAVLGFSVVLYVPVTLAVAGGWGLPVAEPLFGLAIGVAVGMVSAGLARLDVVDGRSYLTPSRMMVLLVTLAILARLGWLVYEAATGDTSVHAHVLAIGGALLGYAAGHSLLMLLRLRRTMAASRARR
ncbi:MAG: hypothetical protein EPO46_11665 [Lysobacter sp.]|nr:MAG: hypothetical protein EPO46_11665 [Lysobacter sp.]